MSERRTIPLNIISSPAPGPLLRAPPILEASSHTVDYTCGNCGVILMHAEDGQVHNLQIQCAECGSYNLADEPRLPAWLLRS